MPPPCPSPPPRTVLFVVLATSLVFGGMAPSSGQDDLSGYAQRAFGLFHSGQYEEAEEYAKRVLQFGSEDANIAAILIDAQLAQGKSQEAAEFAAEAVETFEGYFPMQVKAMEALRAGGRDEAAAKVLASLDVLAKKVQPKTLNARERIALGRAALLLGAEPKLVLSKFYQPARKTDPKLLDGHLAAAELALEKSDFALAARILNEARSKLGPFPDILYLLARSHSPSDRRKAGELIEDALERNPRHVPTLLLQVEHAMDAEHYELARETLAQAREINPNHPLAWAYEAAISAIRDEHARAKKARARALEPWPANPEVDYLIGTKISQQRRFAEGSEYLRKALDADPNHLRARRALGQNLLRLGKEEEGWKLISEVREKDKYDVETYNLMLLHDQLKTFTRLEAGHFAVRMTPGEAAVFGPQVLALLDEAGEVLCEKYGFVPDDPVVVDFFPDQQDFAIRTLGMPGGLGILGATFGNVIAINSPGSPGAMGSNWESTLWHEFCHTVTLGATGNRIPRWLTEGIAVYEERQRDPSCGHKMTPEARRRILHEGEDAADADTSLIPIAQLSAALTAFNDPGTIEFAYYQSSLLVEYLLKTYGADSLRKVLTDLRTNAAAEKVIAKHMATIAKLDTGFAQFARKRAAMVAPGADWELPDPDSPLRRDPAGIARHLEDHPNNIWALTAHCGFLLSERRWEECREPARRLIKLYPGFIGVGNGYAALAMASRQLGDTEEERRTLREWAKRDANAQDAFLRLIELGLEADDWSAVEEDAHRLLGVNPLLRAPHRALGMAAQAQDKTPDAIRAFESLLQLDPVNPADVHFRLAQLHAGDDALLAKRHVLLALEEAPRFREAHHLLLKLDPPAAPSPGPGIQPETSPPLPAPSP